MTTSDTPLAEAPNAPTATTEAETPRDPIQQALEHRFRHTLRTGQVSPLLHLVLRYRQEVPPCRTTTS